MLSAKLRPVNSYSLTAANHSLNLRLGAFQGFLITLLNNHNCTAEAAVFFYVLPHVLAIRLKWKDTMKQNLYSLKVAFGQKSAVLWFPELIWSQVASTLTEHGLWRSRSEIFAQVLVHRQIKDWCPRVFFSGGNISSDAIELHPVSTPASLLRFDESQTVRLVDAKATQTAWSNLRRSFIRPRRRLLPNKLESFPPYDAPLRVIPKSTPGEFRKIAVASKAQIFAGRYLLPYLESYIDQSLPIHGFRSNRSPVSNALSHRAFAFTLSIDLSDFFDHVTCDRLTAAGLPQSLASLITDQEGIARQGYATSPAAANIAFQEADRQIIHAISSSGSGAAYTRYADDLTLSANSLVELRELHDVLSTIIRRSGFLICDRKTKIQAASSGRRVITGVAVSEVSIHPTRYTRRKYRASVHKENQLQARGLKEWMMLKPPSNL
jgi:hypothetical protein